MSDLAKHMLRSSAPRKQESELSYLHRDPEALGSWTVELETIEETGNPWFPRASSLHYDCMRQLVLGKLHKVHRASKVNFNQKIVFGFGTAFHEWLQNDPTIFGDRRRGTWKCSACGDITRFGSPPVKRCACGANIGAYRYEEMEMRTSLCTGHPDMFLAHDGKTYVAEFKTIGSGAFDELSAPLVAHRWQVTLYLLYFAHVCKTVTRDAAMTYYFSKQVNTQAFPVKAFYHEPDASDIKDIKTKLESYQTGIKTKGKKLPEPIGECRNGSVLSYRERSCPCQQLCSQRR